MSTVKYIQVLKIELAFNAEALKSANSVNLESLLTQRATLKDLLIEALSDALTQIEMAA